MSNSELNGPEVSNVMIKYNLKTSEKRNIQNYCLPFVIIVFIWDYFPKLNPKNNDNLCVSL